MCAFYYGSWLVAFLFMHILLNEGNDGLLE